MSEEQDGRTHYLDGNDDGERGAWSFTHSGLWTLVRVLYIMSLDDVGMMDDITGCYILLLELWVYG